MTEKDSSKSEAVVGENREKSTAIAESSAATASDPAKAFHAHLDVCARCEKHPFNLCPIGARLIEEAVSKI